MVELDEQEEEEEDEEDEEGSGSEPSFVQVLPLSLLPTSPGGDMEGDSPSSGAQLYSVQVAAWLAWPAVREGGGQSRPGSRHTCTLVTCGVRVQGVL